LAQFLKPNNLNNVWASGGDRIYPGDTKYATGWQVEIPPRQYFNELDYKQDQMLAHLNQHGIPKWDNETEYLAGESYIQGTSGNVYRCILTHTNQDPDLDVGGTYWDTPFIGTDYTYTKSEIDGKTTIANNSDLQGWTNNTKIVTPFGLSTAFKGANQSLSANGYQKLPGGLIMQWCEGTLINSTAGNVQQTMNFPIAFPTAVLRVFVSTRQTASSGALGDCWATAYSHTNSSATVNMDVTSGGGTGQFAPIILVYGY
jgi:hypothetical protein